MSTLMSTLSPVRLLGAAALLGASALAAAAQTSAPAPSSPPAEKPPMNKPDTATPPQTAPKSAPQTQTAPQTSPQTAPKPSASNTPKPSASNTKHPLVGKTALSSDGNRVNDVRAVKTSADGKVTAIQVKVGGFLGFGGKIVEIPEGKFTQKGDAVQLSYSDDELSKLPEAKDAS